MLSATASLGLVLLWDVEGGLTEIDKFLYSNEETIKVECLPPPPPPPPPPCPSRQGPSWHVASLTVGSATSVTQP